MSKFSSSMEYEIMSMGNVSSAAPKQDFKIIGEYRINWIMNKFFIMHAHGLNTPNVHWDMCLKDEADKKGVIYLCRVCDTKVPGGIVAAALTRRLNEALQS